MNVIRIFILSFLMLVSRFGTAQIHFNAEVFKENATQQIIDDLKERITSKIDEAILSPSKEKVLDVFYVREMLEPYEKWGIDPNADGYYNSINEIYQKFITDPDYKPGEEFKLKIKSMLETRLINEVKDLVGKENVEMMQELQGLVSSAKDQITEILQAVEQIGDINPTDDDRESQIQNILEQSGLTGEFVQAMGDLEIVLQKSYDEIKDPLEIITAIVQASAEKNPTTKIELLFNFGATYGGRLPVVGAIVENLFKVGQELLKAAKQLGGLMHQNVDQFCIGPGSHEYYVSAKQKSFVETHKDMTICPMNFAGIYKDIFYRYDENTNEIFFYVNNKWIDGRNSGYHAGQSDIYAIVQWLRRNGHSSKATDLDFIAKAYNKAVGFIHFRDKVLKERLFEIQELLKKSLSRVAYCEESYLELFYMDIIGFNEINTLLSKHGGLEFRDLQFFDGVLIDNIIDEFIERRYIEDKGNLLFNLNKIANQLKNNIPIYINGNVSSEAEGAIENAKIDISGGSGVLFNDSNCDNRITNGRGAYNFYTTIKQGEEQLLNLKLSYEGVFEKEEVMLTSDKSTYRVDFRLYLNEEEKTDEEKDKDGDGYEEPEDCNDNDPEINPGAEEIPGNDIDENCDGSLDVEKQEEEPNEPGEEEKDEDGDGYNIQEDCDDTDPEVNPGAEEIPDNNKDDDCDGEIDEPKMDPADKDGDGYGIPEDCDDADPEVNPGAEEIPDNNKDDDCDGEIDKPKMNPADKDGDGYEIPEDCDDKDPKINPGAEEIPGNEIDENCDGSLEPEDQNSVNNMIRIIPSSAEIEIGEEITFVVEFISTDGTTKNVTGETLLINPFTSKRPGEFTVTAYYEEYSSDAIIIVKPKKKDCTAENEVWSDELGDCDCIDGYKRNDQGVCTKIEGNDPSGNIVRCLKENEVWDEELLDCVCIDGYKRNDNGKCVEIVEGNDPSGNIVRCLKENEVWDEELLDCVCINGYKRNDQGICVKIQNEDPCKCDPGFVCDEKGDCVSLSEAIEQTDKDEDCVTFASVAAKINPLLAEYRGLEGRFLSYVNKFNKEINDRASVPCENNLLAFSYYSAHSILDRMKEIEAELKSIYFNEISFFSFTKKCPDFNKDMAAAGFNSSFVNSELGKFDTYKSKLESMESWLLENGCDPNEVIQEGQTVQPPGNDPDFVDAGGISTEVPGDGKDNDGDGQQDEIPTQGLPGYNITIVVYDSGNAKDDIFGLSLDGKGFLGNTPKGGLRSFGLNLPPGNYSGNLTVVLAADQFGTFTISVLQNNQSIFFTTGEPPEGTVIPFSFTVTE